MKKKFKITKKLLFNILKYTALGAVLLVLDGTLGAKYAILGFLIYVFAIPFVVILVKWKEVKYLYLHALHHLYKFLTGKEVYYKGLYENVMEEESKTTTKRKQGKQKS